MRIERWTGPPVDTHGYLLSDPGTGEAWAIDAPLDTAAAVLGAAARAGLRLTRLVLTHGHFDHLMDVEQYSRRGVPVSVSPLEAELLAAPQPALFGLPYAMPAVPTDEALHEGARLRLGDTEWEVWHVPGHSPGHVLLYCAPLATLFGGDLLFRGAYGRVDLPGSDPAAMAASLLRLLDLPDETRVLPGHGPEVTIGSERGWLEGLLGDPSGVYL